MFFKRKKFLSVIIAAGGSSSRMNGENKLLCDLDGVPVLCRTIKVFEDCPEVDEIILAAKEEAIPEYMNLIKKYGFNNLSKIVKGGSTRLESVYNAALQCSRKADYIMVHDAARPLVSQEDILTVYKLIKKYGCAAAGRKMTDTVKEISEGAICRTLDRNTLASVQTPQGADRDLLLAALKKAVDEKDDSITDDVSALEKMGAKPALAQCSPMNIKITYKEDLALANAILEMRKKECV